MKFFKKIPYLCMVLLIGFSTLTGCGKKEVVCPFTEFTWESTLEEIQENSGELINSYASIYDGMTYQYAKDYDGMDGIIKYIFDDENRLMSMAWLYIPESADDLESVYKKLCDETTDLYGKSGFSSEQLGAKGQVWYLEGGNILVGIMSTGVNEAIQYQFFHPEVSSEKPQQSN